MRVKLYTTDPALAGKYSPGECCGTRTQKVIGRPDEKHISTSDVERQNLTLRMSSKRFSRLSNGFSKKIENHEHAVSLHYMHYNFAGIHKTLSEPSLKKWTLS